MTAALVLMVALWPVLTFAGGLGFAPLAGIVALPLLPFVVTRFRPHAYMVPALGFLVFAAVSMTWSPMPQQLIEIDFATGSFAIKSDVVRVGALLPAFAVLLLAARRLSDGSRNLLWNVACLAIGLQLATVLALTFLEQQALQVFSGLISGQDEGVQNISRNAILMSLSAPLMVAACARGRSVPVVMMIGAVIFGLTGLALYVRGVQAGLVALALASAGALLAWRVPKYAFRIIGVGVAASILLTPLVFGWLSSGVEPGSVTSSANWRLAIWNRVMDVVRESPILGGGVGVLRTIRETIPSGPLEGELLVPNHAHNMILQMWAETGLVGAALLALAVVAAAWRVPRTVDRRTVILLSALVCAWIAPAYLSFDFWNAGWWAAGGLIGLFALAGPRAEAAAAAPVKEARGVTAGTAIQTPDEEERAEASAEARAPTDNNFNLLRLLFAVFVAVYHFVFLAGRHPDTPQEQNLALLAELGVQGFFILSGFVVMGSIERSRSIGEYAVKRLRRLYPAYFVVVVACAIGALAISPAARADIGGVLRYLGANLAFLNFLEPNLPGLFAANRVPEVNGALWTLKIEVMFYIALPVLAWIFYRAPRLRWPTIILIYVAAEIWRYAFTAASEGGSPVWAMVGRQLPGQMSFFITGVGFYYLRDSINWRSLLAPLGVALLVGSILSPWLEPVRALGLGVVCIWAALAFPRLPDAAMFGDLSYGVYILHFPVIQTLIAFGLLAGAVAQGAAIAAGLVLVLALLMWWTVERPALRADSLYRRRQAGLAAA
ncbi:MAG: acyltransferase family protein [Hyphomonadaceae bacterium]